MAKDAVTGDARLLLRALVGFQMMLECMDSSVTESSFVGQHIQYHRGHLYPTSVII